MRPLRFTVLVLVAILSFAGMARAAAERVALGGSAPDAPLMRQLRVELAAAGYEVVWLDDLARVDLTNDFLTLSRDDDLLALIRIAADSTRLEVWAGDADAGIFVSRGIDLGRAETSSRVVALRAIELLRAGLREIDTRRQAARAAPPSPVERPAPPPPPTPPVPAPVAVEVPKRLAVSRSPIEVEAGAGAGILASQGGAGTMWIASPNVAVWPNSHWGASVLGFFSLDAPTVSAPAGSASVSAYVIGAGPAFRLQPPRSKWDLEAQAGIGASLLRTSGTARTPFVAQSDTATAALAYASAALSFEIASDVALEARAIGGALYRRMEVRFGGRPVAYWGVAYGGGSLGVSVRFR